MDVENFISSRDTATPIKGIFMSISNSRVKCKCECCEFEYATHLSTSEELLNNKNESSTYLL